MIPGSDIDFYGDTTRWFVGRVININDPLQMGRVRIRIVGIHDNPEITEDFLPWAQVVIPVTEGASSGIGANTGIKEQAQVFGIFLDGKNSQVPIVVGSMSKYEENIDLEGDEVGNAAKSNLQSGVDKNKLAPDIVDREYLQGTSNAERCFNFLITKEGLGLTAAQACGIIGNFCVESGPTINPIAQNSTEGSFGIAQWNPAEAAGNRLGQLQLFANSVNVTYTSLYAQLLFLKHELVKFSYLGLGELKQTTTPKEAALVFGRKFERPEQEKKKDPATGIESFKLDENGDRIMFGQQDRIDFAEEMFRKMTS